jgi:hypothetical protein
MVNWYCDICNENKDKSQKARHLKTKKHRLNDPNEPKYYCHVCNENMLLDEREEHENSAKHKNNEMKELPFYGVEIEDLWKCDICGKEVKIQYKEKHLKGHLEKDKFQDEVIELVMKKKIKTIRIRNIKDEKHVNTFFRNIKPLLIEKIRENLKENEALKIKLVLSGYYRKPSDNSLTRFYHHSDHYDSVLQTTNIGDVLENQFTLIRNHVLNPTDDRPSGWSLESIEYCDMYVDKYQPIQGELYIDLPKIIKDKKAIINIKNIDNKCFMWCVLAHLYPVAKDAERVSKYNKEEYINSVNWNDIPFPTPVDEKIYKKFERQNPTISINIYYYKISDDKVKIYPSYITNHEKEKHVDMLYIYDETNSHYCLIKNLSRLVRSQVTSHEKKIELCKRCLKHFYDKNKLMEHKEYCNSFEPTKISFPKEKYIQFKNYANKLKIPFVIYADFESYLHPLPSIIKQDPKKESYTMQYQLHRPMAVAYQLVSFHPDYQNYPYKEYFEDPCEKFIDDLNKIAKEIEALPEKEMFPLTPEEEIGFQESNICHICSKEIIDNDKVKDHCHITGYYRGPAHKICNLNFKYKKFIPVVMHNSANYDIHLIIRELAKRSNKLDIIAQNEERYITISAMIGSKYKIKFIDSYKFLKAALGSLGENLEENQLVYCKKHLSENIYNFIKDKKKRKGIYPYDYMACEEKLNEITLPPKELFYSKLNKSHISDDDYAIAVEMFDMLPIKNLKEYTSLYLKLDVLLLADVFESFRLASLEDYNLDPAQYLTIPSLSWDASLKRTQVKLDILKDVEILGKFEKNIRGGVSFVAHRYAVANNKYMDNYDPSKPERYIMYFDMNNLYGKEMTECLPQSRFKIVDSLTETGRDLIDFVRIHITEIPDDLECGMFIGVDLEYPTNLHDEHKDFPLAAEHFNGKLCLTLNDKKLYGTDYRCLKFYINHGLILKKIHYIIVYNQIDWMRSYIEFNTQKRKEAKTKIEKDFYKLLNNSIYGKTMENIRKRKDIKACVNVNQVAKQIRNPLYKHRTVIDENLVLVHKRKNNLLYDKPIYVGCIILESAKLRMYKFWYDVLKKKLGNKTRLLYHDTDSFIVEFIECNPFEFMLSNREEFDISKYPIDHFIFNNLIDEEVKEWKKITGDVIGIMKDEANGEIIYKYIGLRSKQYYVKKKFDEIKKSKGVKESVVKNELKEEDYENTLKNKKEKYIAMNVIKSRHHEIYTEEIKKIALSPGDDKVVIQKDGISTLPHGHYRLNEKWNKVVNEFNSIVDLSIFI